MEFNYGGNYDNDSYQNQVQYNNFQEENNPSIEIYQQPLPKHQNQFQYVKHERQEQDDDIGKYITQNKNPTNYDIHRQYQFTGNFITQGHQPPRNILLKKIGQQTGDTKDEIVGLFKMKQKRQTQIIKCSSEIKNNYIKAKNGHKSETTELNINVKTMTKNILANKMRMKFFNNYQQKLIKQYCTASANFQTTQKLFGVQKQKIKTQQIQQDIKVDATVMSKRSLSKAESKCILNINTNSDKIRKVCYKQYSSSKFIIDTFKSDKMAFKNKLIMVKFMQGIRFSSIFPQNLKKWKNNKSEGKQF